MELPLSRSLRRRGALGLVLSALQRLPGVRALSIYHRYHMTDADLAAAEAAGLARHDPSLVIVDGRGRVDDMVAVQDKRALFESRMAAGHHSLVVYVDGAPAAYVWAQDEDRHWEEWLGFEIAIDPQEMYCYDIFVGRDFRRHGLARHIAYELIRLAGRATGRTRIMAVIETSNRRSIVANERIGWRRGSTWLYADLGGRVTHRRLR